MQAAQLSGSQEASALAWHVTQARGQRGVPGRQGTGGELIPNGRAS